MEVKIINKSGLPDPAYATEFSSGMDLCSSSLEDIVIESMKWLVVKTGIYLEIPEGYEAQIRPRSGMSLKHGITCINSPGTIDADYRGEIGVILINLSKESYTIKHGDRIAQMVFAPFTKVKFTHTDTLSETVRGEGGYGHTGKNDTMDWSSTKHGQTTVKFKIPTDGLCGDYKSILHELMCDYDNKETDETNDYFIPVSDKIISDFDNGILFDDETGTIMIDESFVLQPLTKDWFFPIKDDKNISTDFNNSDIPPFSSNLWIQCNENDVIILKCFHNTNETDFSIANFKFDIQQLSPNKIKYFIKPSDERVWLYQDEKTGNEIIHESRIIFNPPKLV